MLRHRTKGDCRRSHGTLLVYRSMTFPCVFLLFVELCGASLISGMPQKMKLRGMVRGRQGARHDVHGRHAGTSLKTLIFLRLSSPATKTGHRTPKHSELLS